MKIITRIAECLTIILCASLWFAPSQEGAPAAVQIAQQAKEKAPAAEIATQAKETQAVVMPKIYLNLLLFVEDIDPAKKEQIENLLYDLRSNNFDGIEVPIAGIDGEFAYSIGEKARFRGMGVTGVGYFDPTADITSDDAAIREAGVARFKKMILNTRALADGNGHKDEPIVLSGPLCFPLKVFAPEGSNHEKWIAARKKVALPIYREMAKFAEANLVLLAGEGVQRFETEWLNTASDWTQWIEEVGVAEYPASGVMMDTCHESAGGAGYSEYSATMKDLGKKGRLWNVHFSAVHRGNIDQSWLLDVLPRFVPPLVDAGFGKPMTLKLNGKNHQFTAVGSLEIFNPGGPLKDFVNLRGPKWTYKEAIKVAVDSKQAAILSWRRGLQRR